MQELRVFRVKYLGATTNLGSRVRIYDEIYKETKTIDFDYRFNSSLAIAREYLKARGINVQYCALMKNAYIILTDDFETRIK